MWETNARRPGRPNVLGPANFIRWRERATAFERTAPFYDYRINLTGIGRAGRSRRHGRHARLLPDARRDAARRARVRRRRGPAGTRRGRDPQLRALAAPLRRRPGRRRPHDSAQQPQRHHRRRDAGRHASVPQPRIAGREAGRPLDAVRVHRGAARAARPLHERHRAPQAGRRARRGAGADGHHRRPAWRRSSRSSTPAGARCSCRCTASCPATCAPRCSC